MATDTGERMTARERLCAAATELFYAEGIHTVGIDRVIERAGVAKATLYSVFGSKNGLVKAYLLDRHELLVHWLSQAADGEGEPRERILAMFESLAEEAGTQNPRRVAQQLMLLYDGVLVGSQMDRDQSTAAAAKDVAA